MSDTLLEFEDAVITGDWATVDRLIIEMDPELQDEVNHSPSYQRYKQNGAKAFDPNQPRDNEGQWTDTGGGDVVPRETVEPTSFPKGWEDTYMISGDKGVLRADDVSDEAQSAIEWYTFSYAPNTALRSGRFDELPQDQIRALDAYIAGNETKKKAYVGVRGGEVDVSLRGLNPAEMVGRTYTEPAYTSMSALETGYSGRGYMFSEGSDVEGRTAGPPAQIAIYIPEGSHVGLWTLEDEGEESVETILPRNTEFTVTLAETREDPSLGVYTYLEVKANTENAKMTGEKAGNFTERLHPRDAEGRFAEVGGLGDTALRTGGFSLSLEGDQPHTGWMVSQFGTETSISIESLASEQPMESTPGNPWHTNVKHEIDRFVHDHGDDLHQPNSFLGGWVDGGRLYLDVSHNIQDKGEAMSYAQDNHQLAAYNAGTGEYVEFDQSVPHAAARDAGVKPKTEKVMLKVDADTDLDELTTRLMKALFE